MKPLQTHKLYNKIWHPPKSNNKFYTYDSNDTWLEQLGLGHYTYTLKDLYDVRDWNGRLIGYTYYNPIDNNYTGLVVQVANDAIKYNYNDIEDYNYKDNYKRIKIQVCNYTINDEYFRCWRVSNIEDAVELVRSGWIECIGEDNINQFCNKLYEQHYKDYELSRMFGHKVMDYKGLVKNSTV